MSSGTYGQCTNPSLWMGDLEPYMDETFIRNAFQTMGHVVHAVKFLIDKRTSQPATYCFVDFREISLARKAHTMCTGRKMPNAEHKRFKLNFALAGGIKYENTQPQGSEFSLHVSNLSPDVTDIELCDYFAGRFKTVKHATVVRDGNVSRGYGFVRFHVESDVLEAIRLFNGAVGLGLRPIRVGRALPKSANAAAQGPVTYPQYAQQQYSEMASQYGTGYPGYYDQYKTANGTKTKHANEGGDASASVDSAAVEDDDDDPLQDPEVTIDVDKSNRLILERSEEFYRALEASRWQVVDSITTTYDDLCKA